jgi:hypothetical protein
VCRKDHGLVSLWNILKLFHKNGTFGPQGINDKPVMHDLVAHIDWGPILFERKLDDLDGPINAGTEPARRREKQGQGPALRRLWWG